MRGRQHNVEVAPIQKRTITLGSNVGRRLCVSPDPVEGCPTCDYPLNVVETGLVGGASGTTVTTGATGTLQTLEVSLDWVNVAGDASWAADMQIEIGLPDGSCVAIGGYNVFSACTDLGNYAVVWPSDWTVAASGTYVTAVDLTSAGLTGTGTWSFTLVNGYTTSGGGLRCHLDAQGTLHVR